MRSISNHRLRIIVSSIFLFFVLPRLFSQNSRPLQSENSLHELIHISSLDSSIHLAHQFLIEGTDSVWLDSFSLRRGFDYLIDSRYGKIQLKKDTLQSRFGNSVRNYTMHVFYKYLPFAFQDTYRHHEVVIRKDTLTGKVEKIAKPIVPFTLNDIFGMNIQKSGSIVRGFSMGSNRDLTLNSGFHMQMSGKISDNIDVVAALTDENIPIQPEGTTQNLNEVDKVFVQLRGSHVGATLGDFALGLSGNEFGSFSRKLQGAEGIAQYTSEATNGNLLISAATAKGKYTTNQIQGLDAVQGPYTLFGKNNERNIIIIAGTEKIYVDGEEMSRGEINDYTIDYSNAQVTFSSKRMINRASRIIVDFQYTDQNYTRNLFAVKSENDFFNKKVNFHATYITENDDQNSPVNITLSDSDKTILGDAGNNLLRASRTGIDSVGVGKGQYVRIDTTVSIPDSTTPLHITIYRYKPEDTLHALYSLTFSFLGAGGGDYTKIAPGRYDFVGLRGGSYSPIRLLPLPESHSLTDFEVTAQLTDALKLSSEFGISNYDKNRFSDLDDQDNAGSAFNFGLQFAPGKIRIGNSDLGSLKINIKNRFLGKDFSPIDRINPVEFNRAWNIQDDNAASENLFQGDINYQPVTYLKISGTAGQVKKGEYSTSNRYTMGGQIDPENAPITNYSIDVLNSRNKLLQSKAQLIRDGGSLEYKRGIFLPGITYAHEFRMDENLRSDSAIAGSYRFHEVTPRLILQNISGMKLLTEFGYRLDDSLLKSTLTRASKTVTQQYELQLPSTESFSSSLGFTLRDRKFTDDFISRGNADNRTTLIRDQTRYNPFNRGVESEWFYEASAERSAKNVRIFQQVPKGTGNYIYAGDVNSNHITDEPDFQLSRFDGDYIAFIIPSDQYIPVTDVKASMRIRLNGSRLFRGDDWFSSIVTALSSETYLRVAEKSSNPETKDIYFLHLGTFLNERTTLEGANITMEDLYILENNPKFSLRFHYDQNRGFTQFSLQNERTYNSQQSMRLRWHLVEEIANEINVVHRIDNLSSTQLSNRVRGISSNTLSTDWSYRPIQKVEFGFNFGVGRATNFDTASANLNDQGVHLTYSIETKGQARIEFSREEVLLTNSGIFFPFELTGGKVAGKTWLWHFAFDYRITDFLQSSVGYDGRIENGGAPIHSGRAELRAFF